MSSPRHGALSTVTGLVFALGAGYTGAAGAFEWKDLWQRKDQQAHQLLQSGEAAQAAELFTDNRWQGVGHFEAGNYQQAIDAFNAGSGPVAAYNRGVAEVMNGDIDAAIDSFESVLQAQPDHQDAANNLKIARELAKQRERQSGQSQSGEQSGEDQSQERNAEAGQDSAGQDASQSQDNSSSADDGSEGQQSQQDTAADSAGAPSQSGAGENAGELTDRAAASAAGDDQRPDDEAAIEALQDALSSGRESEDEEASENAQGLQESDTDTQSQQQALAGAPGGGEVSEESQATEQWLRRIPDDPSQLLRNKIKLNHLLEHPDVGDTAEPW